MRPPEPTELSKSKLVSRPPADGEPVDLGAVTEVVPRTALGRPDEALRPGILASAADGGHGELVPPRLPSGPRFPLSSRLLAAVATLVLAGAAALVLGALGGGDGGGPVTTDSDRLETGGSDQGRSGGGDRSADGSGTGPDPTPLAVDGSTVPAAPGVGSSSTSVALGAPSPSSTPSSTTSASTPATSTSASSTASSSTTTPSSSAATSSTPTTGTSSTRKTTPGATAPGRGGTSTTTTTTITTVPTPSPIDTGGGGSAADGLALPSGAVIWEEHFDRLDTSVWQLEHSTYGDGNGELQCYRPDNVSVSGGTLVLRARSETVTCPNGSTRQVSSGMVRSRGVTFSPGQAIEFRVKLTPADPSDQGGLWPAVWASSWAGSWPAGGELDWLEVMTAEDPTRAMFSLHHADASGAHRVQNRGVTSSADFSASWHTVRFDYGRDGVLRWYLDGAPAFTVDGAATLQGWPAPFDAPIGEIKINLAVGGRPGPLAPGALGSTGATFAVDYIRIVQL